MEAAVCVYRCDIRQTVGSSFVKNALNLTEEDVENANVIITNPPYDKPMLLPLIDHFISLKPTWLLLPSDMMHNIYFAPYVRKCRTIISVGRLYWQPNKVRGKSNFCWFYWPKGSTGEYATEFIGREER